MMPPPGRVKRRDVGPAGRSVGRIAAARPERDGAVRRPCSGRLLRRIVLRAHVLQERHGTPELVQAIHPVLDRNPPMKSDA